MFSASELCDFLAQMSPRWQLPERWSSSRSSEDERRQFKEGPPRTTRDGNSAVVELH